jgi:hypothetical protein
VSSQSSAIRICPTPLVVPTTRPPTSQVHRSAGPPQLVGDPFPELIRPRVLICDVTHLVDDLSERVRLDRSAPRDHPLRRRLLHRVDVGEEFGDSAPHFLCPMHIIRTFRNHPNLFPSLQVHFSSF